jgi:hypothetical protein
MHNGYNSHLKSVRVVRKGRSRQSAHHGRTVHDLATWSTRTSDQEQLTLADRPPKMPDGPRPETVLSGLILRTVCSTNRKNHTVPTQTIFGTCGLSAHQSQTVRTIIQRLSQKQRSLVRTADDSALRPGRSAVQRNRIGPKWSDFGPLWWSGRSALKTQTVRASKTLHFLNKLLKEFLTHEIWSVVSPHANATTRCSMRH